MARKKVDFKWRSERTRANFTECVGELKDLKSELGRFGTALSQGTDEQCREHIETLREHLLDLERMVADYEWYPGKDEEE